MAHDKASVAAFDDENQISLDHRTDEEADLPASKEDEPIYGDDALQALALEGGSRAVIDDATNKRLRRRIGKY